MLKMQSPLVNNSKLILIGDTKIGIQKQFVESFASASYSSIISLASYLCYHLPNIPPPGVQPVTNNLIDHQFPSTQLSYNHYMEPWCDYLIRLATQQSQIGCQIIKNHQQTFICYVTDSYLEIFNNDNKIFIFENLSNRNEALQKFKFSDSIEPLKRRKIGLINFGASQLRTDIYRPKINIFGLLLGIWKKEGDDWKQYLILKEDYPSQDDIEKTDIFILSGSHYSVNDEDPKVNKTIQMLIQALKKYPKLKILGLCFGHQAIGKYYGGIIVKKPLVAGIERIFFKPNICQGRPFLSGVDNKPFYISQYHNDNITEDPQGFQILSWSNSCKNEAMISHDNRILSFQFHSQYTKEYTKGYEKRVKSYYPDDPLKDFAGELKAEYKTEEVQKQITESCITIRKLIRGYIDYDI